MENSGGKYLQMMPCNTAITWNDVYRFSGNNFIGRKTRERFMAAHPDPGRCLADMADFVCDSVGGGYIPANKYIAFSEHDLAPENFDTVVGAVAKDVADQRNKENEPYEYWKFIFDNSLSALEVCFKDGVS